MKQLLAALALLVATYAPAQAGGLRATIEGPAKDGVTYTVRVLECPPGVTLKPWLCADGLENGKLLSLRLKLEPTAQPGVYTFRRTWSLEGDWMLRLNLGDPPPGPVTVAAVGHDGRVQENQLFWNTYGVPECRAVLERIAKAKGIKLPEGC